MVISLNEAITRIKAAGQNRVRVVPMPGQSIGTGKYQIDILEGTGWVTVAKDLPQSTATDLVSQALNRVILG